VKTWHCQLAVAGVQTAFVIGSVYLKSSFKAVSGKAFHPIVFAFVREAVAAPILCIAAFAYTGKARFSFVGVEGRRCGGS
jgi:hypothetical protein